MKAFLNLLVAGLLSLVFFSQGALADTDILRKIPIQEGGRVKPFDSFAREALMLVYGRSQFNKRPAHEIILTWFLLPEVWGKKDILQMKNRQLKQSLGLAIEKDYFSFDEIMTNEHLSLVFQELAGKQQAKEKLDPYFQSVQQLQNQIGVFHSIVKGEAFRLVPDPESDHWLALDDPKFPPAAGDKFRQLCQAFVQSITQEMHPESAGVDSANGAQIAQLTGEFMDIARNVAAEKYPLQKRIDVEAHYNKLEPFMWSWIVYLMAAIIMSLAWYTGGSKVYKLAWVTLLVGFLLHTYGFALRIYIAQRPPVSNMYESVIWVSWGGVLFSTIIEAIYRPRFVLLAGSIGAIICLVLASLAPSILDASISPLQPVLVSNYWLIIHVMTISLSYSAFMVGLILGDVGLCFAIRNEAGFKLKIQKIADAIYRTIQIGVVLLAAGIILGGIWADYSWGRFWGWDPKETWALVALLGYIAILHGRLAGWLRAFGVNAAAVVGFSLVIMAWYGVNFVLGAGLHTYGFGGGGVQYVAGFVIAHLIFVIYAVLARQKKQPAY